MSKTCEDIQPHLFDYSVGEVEDERRVEVEAHLGECSACRTRLQELEGTGVALKRVPSLTDVEATEEFRHITRRLARVESQKRVAIITEEGFERDPRRIIEARRRASGVSNPGVKMLAAAAAIGILIVALILLDRLYRGEDEPALGDSVARLAGSVGTVEVFFRSASGPWSELTDGRRLFKGESVRTGEQSVAQFTLAGGKTVWLGPLTRAAFTESLSEFGVAVRVERGSVVVASHGKPFRLEAEFGTVSSSGGALHLASVEDGWWLDVFKGSARVKATGMNEIAAGHCSSIGPNGATDLGKSDLAKVAPWRFRMLSLEMLERLFGARRVRILEDGRAFVEYSELRGRLEPGAEKRLDGLFAGDVSLAVEVDDWAPGRLSVGLAEAGKETGPKLEFVPGKGGTNFVSYSSDGKMDTGTGDPLPASISTHVKARLERSGSDCNVYLGDAAVGSFRTDFHAAVVPVIKALEKAVTVRSITAVGRPDEGWAASKLGVVIPGEAASTAP